MRTKQSYSPLPAAVLRSIRQYRPTFRREIVRAVQERIDLLEVQGKVITAEEIGECASGVIFAEQYDKGMERLCLKAHREGRSRPLQEFIDELDALSAGASGE